MEAMEEEMEERAALVAGELPAAAPAGEPTALLLPPREGEPTPAGRMPPEPTSAEMGEGGGERKGEQGMKNGGSRVEEGCAGQWKAAKGLR